MDDKALEARVEAALDWLVSNAADAAQARSDREHLKEYGKHLLAKIVEELRSKGKESMASLASKAEASEDYRNHLDGYREAIRKDEWFRWKRETANAVVSVYQTNSSNQRAARII